MAFKRSIHEFLNLLTEDDDLLQAYEANPREVMEEYGLSEAQQDKLFGSNAQIRAAVKDEVGTHVAFVIRMAPQP